MKVERGLLRVDCSYTFNIDVTADAIAYTQFLVKQCLAKVLVALPRDLASRLMSLLTTLRPSIEMTVIDSDDDPRKSVFVMYVPHASQYL